jgi:hypothetical protein
MKYFLILLAVFSLSGCFDFRSVEDIKKEAQTEFYAKNPDLKKAIEEKKKIESIEIEVPAGKSRLDALVEERAKNKGEIELAKQKIKDLQAKDKSLNAQIDQAELDQKRFYLNLISGISLFLFILCGAIAFVTFISNPIISQITKWAAMIFIIISALCFTTSIMLPYLVYLGLGIVVLGVISTIIGLIAWRNNSTALKEVVGAVQENKELIPDYKTKFRKYIGTNSNKIIDNIRSHL